MAEPAALLLAWLSPGYPVGAYTYSHGLEHAVAAGDVTGPAALSAWIADCLEHGAGRTDAILLAGAMRAPEDEALAERARALAASRERLLESEAQGAAFATVTAAAWGPALAPAPYPVAFGRAAAAHGIAPALAASLYLQAFAANLVSAGIRLVPLGQTDGQRVLAGLVALCETLGRAAAEAPIDAVGTACFRADIAAMRHETQRTRLFRT